MNAEPPIARFQMEEKLGPLPSPALVNTEVSAGPLPDSGDSPELIVTCPHCQAAMELESHESRPSWRELFYGPDHPQWFEWLGSG